MLLNLLNTVFPFNRTSNNFLFHSFIKNICFPAGNSGVPGIIRVLPIVYRGFPKVYREAPGGFWGFPIISGEFLILCRGSPGSSRGFPISSRYIPTHFWEAFFIFFSFHIFYKNLKIKKLIICLPIISQAAKPIK